MGMMGALSRCGMVGWTCCALQVAMTLIGNRQRYNQESQDCRCIDSIPSCPQGSIFPNLSSLLRSFEFPYLTLSNPNNVWGWFKSGETCHLEKFFLMPDIQLHALRNISIVHS